jgi:hypothetical protein
MLAEPQRPKYRIIESRDGHVEVAFISNARGSPTFTRSRPGRVVRRRFRSPNAVTVDLGPHRRRTQFGRSRGARNLRGFRGRWPRRCVDGVRPYFGPNRGIRVEGRPFSRLGRRAEVLCVYRRQREQYKFSGSRFALTSRKFDDEGRSYRLAGDGF